MAESMQPAQPAGYPMALSVDYPDRSLDRLTTFFRILAIIPIAIILGMLSGGGAGWEDSNWRYPGATGGLLFLPTLLMILFRQKYPRWWFDWNLGVIKFSTRVTAYFALLRDEYPSTDEDQAVHVNTAYPNVREGLSRWMPLVKWLLAIPHYIVLAFLVFAAVVATIIAWFAILLTGRYPKDLFEFVVGVMRWFLRVNAYAFLLVTDRYPPFSLSAG